MTTLNVIEDIAIYIEDTLASVVDDSVYLGHLPEQAGKTIAVFEYAGRSPEYTGRGTTALRRPRVQVLVRHDSYTSARSAMVEVWELLDAVVDRSLNGKHYASITALGEPEMRNIDDHGRVIFVSNFEVIYNN